MAGNFIDWDSINVASQNTAWQPFTGAMAGTKTYRDVAGAEIMPLLQQGIDPTLQKAIDEIVRQGQLSKERTLSDVTTSAQRRGLTSSSIESGDLTQAATQAELGQQGQITGILAQDAASKRDQMIQFLTQAYGMDFQQATSMAANLSQLMMQSQANDTEYNLAMKTIEANKEASEFKWTDLLPSAIGAAGTVLAGPGGGLTASALAKLLAAQKG